MSINQAFALLRSLPPEWGATEAEIHQMELRLGLRIPPPLRELYMCTGGPGHMHWLFPQGAIPPLDALPELQEIAKEIMSVGDPALNPTFPILALSQRQGYFFSFVPADGSDADPVMFGYQEYDGYTHDNGDMTISQCIAIAVRERLGLS